jgi:hypothetical protein
MDQERQHHEHHEQEPGRFTIVEVKKNGERTGRKAGPFTRGEAELVKIALETMYAQRLFRIEPEPLS